MFSSGLKIHETCRSVARAAEVAYDIIKDLETTGKSTVGKIITIISQGHNLCKLKYLSLEEVKIVYFQK